MHTKSNLGQLEVIKLSAIYEYTHTFKVRMFLTGHLQDYHSVFPEYFLYSPYKPLVAENN